MEVNVSNMPINTLYRFDTNRYVFSTMLNETRNGNYKQEDATRFTEVYEITDEGYMSLVASGKLIDNPNVFDYSKEFAIRDYDRDDVISFKVTMFLEEVGIKELHELREAIARNYNRRNK